MTMITPSYLGETIEYSSLHACRSTLEDPTPWTPGGKNVEPTFNLITDGTSNTILAVEWDGKIPWIKPEDIPFEPKGAMPALGGFSPDGFNALFCDGSVRYISNKVEPNFLKALITRAGGEVVQGDGLAPGPTQPLPLRP